MLTALKTPIEPMPDEGTDSKKSFAGDRNGQQYMQFIEMAAHDLQAPLRKLGVLTGLLTDKYKALNDEEAEQYIRRIHSCIDAMRSLIEGFTELAEAIPETMHYESCDPGQIIKNILRESTSQIKLKEAAITVGEMPVVQGDKVQLRLLFKNLLENSFRFSKPGIPLKITIHAGEATGSEKEHFRLDEKKCYYKIAYDEIVIFIIINNSNPDFFSVGHVSQDFLVG